jgi:sulfide dehydrogenase cytochrome subunit
MPKFLKMSLLTAGLSLAASGALAADVAASCAGCHGVDGVSTDSAVPTIAGMSVDYLADTLHAYKKKARPAAEVTISAGDKKGTKSDMFKIVADLSDADIDNLAKTFAQKKFVRAKQTADAALAAKGKDLHDKLCDKCHTEGGSVAGDDSGILAGQWIPYLKAQLVDYKSGKRPAPTKMQPKIDQVQPADIDALAAYYGSAK